MNDCFKNSFEMKIVGINVNLEITVLKETLVIKDFLIISKLFSWFSRWKVTAFWNLWEKESKNPHTRCLKSYQINKNNLWEWDFYKWGTCAEKTIILAQIYSQRFAKFKLGTVAWMEVQPLKDLENAVIHPYVMLSALQLISWRGRLVATVYLHEVAIDRATLVHRA
jgi:hypothetical protein